MKVVATVEEWLCRNISLNLLESRVEMCIMYIYPANHYITPPFNSL